MYSTQYVLALLALNVNLVKCFSWDIVAARGNRLEFYNDGVLAHSAIPASYYIIWIAYDSRHNRVLFSDQYSENDQVNSFDIATGTTQSLIKQGTIRPLAYDSATEILFGATNEGISAFLLKPGTNDDDNGNLVIALESEETPREVAVASCDGYIYWTTYKKNNKIERVRINGTDREVEVDSSTSIKNKKGLTIDQQTQKLYWIQEEPHKLGFSIESADLNGRNKKTLYIEISDVVPVHLLTVSKDFLYWGEYIRPSFWQFPKDVTNDTDTSNAKPKSYSMTKSFSYGSVNFTLGSQAIAANYKIEEQTKGIMNCKSLRSILPSCGETDDHVTLFCIHGTKVRGESRCDCTQGYIGERCDVSVCQNYCLHGVCSVNEEGQPMCRCSAGYSGKRCEVNQCHKFCLNDGVCSLNNNSNSVCQCNESYKGERCDVSIICIRSFQTVSMLKQILNTDVAPVTLRKRLQSTCGTTVV